MNSLTIEQKLALVVSELDEYFPILEERIRQLEEDNARSARVSGMLTIRLIELEAKVAEAQGEETGGLPADVKSEINRLISDIGEDWGFGGKNDSRSG